MKIAVCDDDASTRFMVKRLLEDSFGCTVVECSDGVELLEKVGREKVGLIMLDLEMPTMNGLETLEELRASEWTRAIPVVVLSRERDDQVIAKLVRLGISGYILKPLRNHLVVAKLEAVIATMPRISTDAMDLDRLRLSQDTPALLIDGNLDFRYFFVSQLERYGRVVQADSGAAALSLCRKAMFRVIFVGTELGVVSPERVAKRLRDLHHEGMRLIQICDGAGPPANTDLFDASIRRSYVPETFRTLLRPFILVPGPFTALMELVPELPTITSSAATQVFGMMFDSEIAVSTDGSPMTIDFSSTLELILEDRFAITLGVHLSKAAALGGAAKMAGMAIAEVQDEDCLSVAGELGNIVVGRVHARFGERQMKSVCALPQLITGACASPDEASGLVQRFTMPGVGDFLISMSAVDLMEQSRLDATAAATAKVDAAAREKEAAAEAQLAGAPPTAAKASTAAVA